MRPRTENSSRSPGERLRTASSWMVRPIMARMDPSGRLLPGHALHHGALAEDGDAVAHPEDLREVVGDEDDPDAPARERTKVRRRSTSDAVSAEVGSSIRSTRASLETALMICTIFCTSAGRSRTRAAGSMSRPKRSRRLAHLGELLPAGRYEAKHAADGFLVQVDVLRNREGRDEVAVLVDRDDAAGNGVPVPARCRPCHRRGSGPRRSGWPPR